MITAVAHRGDPYRYRENTLASLRSAVRAGADAVEMDVRLTRDGVPVLLHDATLKRLWGRRAAVADLPAGALDGVPALGEALAATAGTRVLLDLLVPGGAGAVVAAVQDAGAADRTYYCGGPTVMLALRRADPAAEIALTWTRPVPPRPALLDTVHPRWLNLRFALAGPPLIGWAHDHGLLVGTWTADLRRTMAGLRARGVDAITTNRIDVLRDVLDS